MYFRKVVFSAIVVGLCGGLFLSILQSLQVTPLILEAEKYEVNVTSGHGHEHSHAKGTVAWEPADGMERFSVSAGTNILAAIGFALLLISFMSWGDQLVSLRSGVLWGVAGFVVFFVAPALGLSAEIPGASAADLQQRQVWWLLTVVCTASGLACLTFLSRYYKLLGLILVAVPHIVGAPQPEISGFMHSDPTTVSVLEGLQQQFIHAATMTNGIYWILLGLLSAFMVSRYVKLKSPSVTALRDTN